MTDPKPVAEKDMQPLDLLVAWHEERVRVGFRSSPRYRALLLELLRRLHAGDRALEEDRKGSAESSDRG